MSSMDYYDILGCTKDSSPEDIKRAYRALSLKLHPDKNAAEFDRGKFQRVLEAWHALRDPNSRERYDAMQKQEELDAESVPVYARISVEEMQIVQDDEHALTYPCRCGGSYHLQKEYVEEEHQLIRVPCSECTFLVVVET